MFKGTPFRGRRLLLALLLPTLIFMSLFFAQGAWAVVVSPPPDTGTVSPSAPLHFTGSFDIPGNTLFMAGDPGTAYGSPCPGSLTDTGPVGPKEANAPGAVCGHISKLVPTENGNGQACVYWVDPSMINEVDPWVADLTPGSATFGTVIGSPGAIQTNANGETFVCTNTFGMVEGGVYEVLINDPSMFSLQPYRGTVTLQQTNPFQNQCFKFHGEHEEGSGQDDHGGKFHGEGHRDDQRGEKDGHARYKNDKQGYDFQTTHTDNVVFTNIGTPLTPIWQMEMTGTGLNNGVPVTFVIDMVDAGLSNGVGDSFLITTSDGKVGGGNVQQNQGKNNHRNYN